MPRAQRTCGRAAFSAALTRFAILSATLSALLVSSRAAADDLLYSMTQRGRLAINGTVLDPLPSEFDEDSNEPPEERWVDLAILGPDRYALRRDGQLYKNGKRHIALPFSTTAPFQWLTMTVTPAGNVHALRQDGMLTANTQVITTLPIQVPSGPNVFFFPFRQVLVDGNDIWSLRVDGALFRNNSAANVYKLSAGNGLGGLDDGKESDTVWVAMAIAPDDGDIYALRADGAVYRAALPAAAPSTPPPNGALVLDLPFPTTAIGSGDFYFDIAFDTDGKWYVLRANGQIYSETGGVVPVVDLPGDGVSDEDIFIDLTVFGTDFYVVRGDGRVYKNGGTTEIINLPRSGYQRVGVSADPPDLTNFKKQKPVGAIYKVIVVDGEDATVPVVVTDGDKLADELIITPVDPLPPGAVWSEETATLLWEGAGPVGAYAFTVMVDDGETKPVLLKYKIKVIAPDLLPEKNKPPIVSKVKKPQALVGHELSLPILATDPDGDEVTIEARTDKYPFTAGATFDAESGIFTWTPAFEDFGKVTAEFTVSDGIKAKKLKLSINVINPLIF